MPSYLKLKPIFFEVVAKMSPNFCQLIKVKAKQTFGKVQEGIRYSCRTCTRPSAWSWPASERPAGRRSTEASATPASCPPKTPERLTTVAEKASRFSKLDTRHQEEFFWLDKHYSCSWTNMKEPSTEFWLELTFSYLLKPQSLFYHNDFSDFLPASFKK